MKQAIIDSIFVLMASALFSILAMSLPATTTKELSETVLFGVFGGFLVWCMLAVTAMISSDIVPKIFSQSRTSLFVGYLIALYFGAGLSVVFISALLGKPFWGLAAICGAPIAGGALLWAAILAGFSRRKIWLGSGAVVIYGFLLLLASGPLRSRPMEISFGSLSAKPSIRILSWNIGLGQPLSAPSQEVHLALVAETIHEQNIDIACLQELASEKHLELLLQELGGNWHGELAHPKSPRATAVLTRLPAVFSRPNSGLFFGGPTFAEIQSAEKSLKVISVHLPPEHNSTHRAAYVEWLDSFTEANERGVIIAGDFNIEPDGWWDQLSTIFSDNLELDRKSLNILTSSMLDTGFQTAATGALSRRIDYIFLPSKFRPIHYQVLYGKKVGRMDHHPIILLAEDA